MEVTADEVAFLKAIVANPYNRDNYAGYVDWLIEQNRVEEAQSINKHAIAIAPSISCNSISVGELIGHLLTFPLDAPVIYRACSDWSELRKDEVWLHKAEEQKINYRSQNGFMDYNEFWFAGLTRISTQRQRDRFLQGYPEPSEQPHFVTVCCFPGN